MKATYQDGTEIKVGDIVRFEGPARSKKEISGEVIEVSSETIAVDVEGLVLAVPAELVTKVSSASRLGFFGKIINRIWTLPFGLMMLIAAMVFDGYVIATLWGWFMVPIFGMVALSIPQALGLSVVFSKFAYKYGDGHKVGRSTIESLLFVLHPYYTGAWFLLFGYVVKSFM